MKELHNIDLSNYTTVRIGGIAKTFLIPENTSELLNLIQEKTPKYYIGGGSNLLINDREFELVVNLKEFDSTIINLGNGYYKVGASTKLPVLINIINKDGYGGIEYLCNVPGLVGGAIVMNAGSGKKTSKYISDYVKSVEVITNNRLVVMEKQECHFSHRNSIFRNNSNFIITSVLFEFVPKTKEESNEEKRKKMNYYLEKQDPSYPNFGSVFSQSSHRIMRFAKKLRIGNKVHFSKKTANWIINEGGGYRDAINAIRKVELLHRIFKKKCDREVIVWE